MTQRGTLLGGRYELDQIIGRGGMAEVWRARDTRLARDVAVKRLRIDLASDPTFQARFRKEAQSAAGLNHPNIVAVYDTGEELDPSSQVSVPYIVMELVEGVTLRDVLRDGRKILPERALEFTAGVLDALDYSHRAGIIHRDIKPANVMLTPEGAVKVMDFGIARAIADTSATMTQTAAVIGTAQYLSPEQARGEKVDQRSDLYSVGCLLYELLVSEPPFKGDSPVSVAYQHVREAPVPPSHVDPEVGADMDTVTLKALAKSADDRYQDAREMRADVLRAMNHQKVHAVVVGPGANDPTTVMASENETTARRAAVTPAPTAVAMQASPAEIEEEEKKKSRGPLVVLLVLAGLLLVGMVVAIAMILNPGVEPPEMVPVPAVTGVEQASAENTITNARLVPEVTEVVGTEEDKGKVLKQTPPAGEEVEVNSTVVLEVSLGPDTKVIPTIIGLTEAEAKRTLSDAGFNNVDSEDADPADEDPTAKAGTVTDSTPQEGGDVDPEGLVTITIATGNSIVPTLTDATEDGVKDLAKAAGFDSIDIKTEETNEAEPGIVFRQDPEAGTPFARSDTITVYVAKVTERLVPNLLGFTEAEAKDLAKKAGFDSLDIRTEETVDTDPGKVVRQDPEAGNALAGSETITIWLAEAAAVTELKVPNLRGYTEPEAKGVLTDAGFTAEPTITMVKTDEEVPGIVFAQSPAANSSLEPAGAIEIRIAVEP